MQWWAGQLVRANISVYDYTATPPALADPTTLTVATEAPGVTIATKHIWPADNTIIRESLGKFHYDIDTTGSATGNWEVAVFTTGGPQASVAKAFPVQALPVTLP